MGRLGRMGGGVLAVLLLFASARAAAHHSLAEYDDTQVRTVDGTLVDVHLKNPHSLLTVEVNVDGQIERWTVEWLAVLMLRRDGMTDMTLKPGDHLIITGHPSRDRTIHRLWLRTIKRPADGWAWSGGF